MDQSFSIINIYKMALSTCKDNAGLLFRRIWFALLALEVVRFITNPYMHNLATRESVGNSSFLPIMGLAVLSGIFYLILVVAVHRTFLLDQNSINPHWQWKIRRYEINYLYSGIRVLAVILIPGIGIFTLVSMAGLDAFSPYISALLWGVVLGWVGMIFPAAAIDSEPKSLGAASQFSKPYRLKLIILLTIPQVVFLPLQMLSAETMENTVFSIIVGLSWNLTVVFQIALITLSYKNMRREFFGPTNY